MFKIEGNGTIRINRGDDSVRFPLILNQGTKSEQIPLTLSPVISMTSEYVKCRLDKEIWVKNVKEDGIYSFMFLNEKWLLLNNEVNLSKYGIEVLSVPENYNTIVVTYNREKFEVYFHICEMGELAENFLVKKTFSKTGDIVTEYSFKPPMKEVDNSIINEDGQLMLRLSSDDTIDLEDGQYYYLIRIMYWNKDLGKYITTTITNKLPFYVIDDGYADRRW